MTDTRYERTGDGKWLYFYGTNTEGTDVWDDWVTKCLESAYQLGLKVGKADGCKETAEKMIQEITPEITNILSVLSPKNGIVFIKWWESFKSHWLSPAKEGK